MIALGLQNPNAPTSVSYGGVMTATSQSGVLEQEAALAKASLDAAHRANDRAPVQALSGHIRRHWELAKDAKKDVERDMLRAVRALRGQYDPEKENQLKEQGSSLIFMMLFASKARQAKALLGDVLLGAADDKPWSIRPSPQSTLPEDVVAQIMEGSQQMVMHAEMSGLPMSVDEIRQLLRDAKTRAEAMIAEEARARCQRAEKKVEDMLAEGGFTEALDAFLDDLMWAKTAILKGPVVRRRGVLAWAPGADGKFEPTVTIESTPHWERVDPLMAYPAPWSRDANDGFFIERHRLTSQSLNEMIGVEGYSEDAIRAVIKEHGIGGLHDWLSVDTERASAEGRTSTSNDQESDLIDALQYWGSAIGKLLREWGMSAEEVPDEDAVYAIEAWLVGNWVIKSVINADPLARRPYYIESYKRQPGAFWGTSLHDTMRDCEDMCNAAARALVNNVAISSGPQVWVNVDRVPSGEDISQLFPWKIWQTTNDAMGSSAAPMGFFQPASNAAELMGIYEKFSQLADEYTGVPRYMTGDGIAGGAGRTASGMSMMIGNAGKTIKSAVSGIDLRVIAPVISRAYEFLMRYVGDPDIKGDLRVVARGALSLVAKDSAQVRRNEFLALALQSPVVQQMIGPEGIAELLRATTRTLDLNSADIVPTTSELRLKMAMMAQAQAAAAQNPPQEGSAGPGRQAEKPPQRKELMNGAPATDNFGA